MKTVRQGSLRTTSPPAAGQTIMDGMTASGPNPSSGAPWRWRLAGAIDSRVPDVRGRQRLANLLSGPRRVRRKFDVTFGPDLTFEVDGELNAHLYFLKFAKPSLAAVFDAALRPGDVVFDVGANEGIYTCWSARRVGPGGHVYAFEPVPSTRSRLQGNLQRNGLTERVTVIPKAVGAEVGQTTIWLPPEQGHGRASVAQIDGASEVPAEVTTLDSLKVVPEVRLVKIDVEGFEPAVLRGAINLLQSASPPVVLLEVVLDHLSRLGFAVQDALGPLTDAGYSVYSLTTSGLQEVTDPSQCEATNVLALHPRHHNSILRDLAFKPFPRDQTY